jgi:hypothetical protein
VPGEGRAWGSLNGDGEWGNGQKEESHGVNGKQYEWKVRERGVSIIDTKRI